MHSPAKAKHLRATQNLAGLLRAFVQRYGLGEVFSEKALICLTRNDYEPDVVFFARAKADRFTADQIEFPAPDCESRLPRSSTISTVTWRGRCSSFAAVAAKRKKKHRPIDGLCQGGLGRIFATRDLEYNKRQTDRCDWASEAWEAANRTGRRKHDPSRDRGRGV